MYMSLFLQPRLQSLSTDVLGTREGPGTDTTAQHHTQTQTRTKDNLIPSIMEFSIRALLFFFITCMNIKDGFPPPSPPLRYSLPQDASRTHASCLYPRGAETLLAGPFDFLRRTWVREALAALGTGSARRVLRWSQSVGPTHKTRPEILVNGTPKLIALVFSLL